MEAKNVRNKVILTFILLFILNNAFSQKNRYLLFDINIDSIITLGNIKYYKMDNNLFDINRYSQIDTLNSKELKNIKFSSVKKLWKEGKNISDSILKEGVKKKKIRIIETNNQVFEYIYILEKTSNCNYKRTRVWWIDY